MTDMSTVSALRPMLAPYVEVERLRAMSTQDLRTELGRALTLSADNIVQLAAIWRELEGRGEDLDDLRNGLGAYLPLIANGRLAAEAVVQFAGQRAVLRGLLGLPIEEQRRLSSGASVKIVTVNADGAYEEREIPATRLTGSQARLLLDQGRLRRPREQLALLEAAPAQQRKRRRGQSGKISVDRATGRLRVGRTTFAPHELIGAIEQMFPDDAPEAKREKTVPLNLTMAEHRALKRNAAEAGVSMVRYVLAAVRATGGFAGPA